MCDFLLWKAARETIVELEESIPMSLSGRQVSQPDGYKPSLSLRHLLTLIPSVQGCRVLRVRERSKEILFAARTRSEIACDDCMQQYDDVLTDVSELIQPHAQISTSGTGIELVTTPQETPDFERTQPLFCLRNEVNIPLLLVAWKCRDPKRRRRAVQLLRMRRMKEGLWDSNLLAAIAERIVELEERDIDNVGKCSDVPASARLDSLGIMLKDVKRGVSVSFGQERGRREWQERLPIIR